MFIDYVKKYEKSSLVTSILLLILACFFIFKPLESVIVLIYAFGVIAFIEGIVHMVSYARTPSDLKLMSFELIEGILEIIAGFMVMLFAKQLTAIFPIMLGIWIITKSIIQFQISLNLKTIPESKWLGMFIVSILTLVLGLIIVLNPFPSAIAVTTLAGVVFAICELVNIIDSIYTLCRL